MLATNIRFAYKGSDVSGDELPDETQFDTTDRQELAELWFDFCLENDLIQIEEVELDDKHEYIYLQGGRVPTESLEMHRLRVNLHAKEIDFINDSEESSNRLHKNHIERTKFNLGDRHYSVVWGYVEFRESISESWYKVGETYGYPNNFEVMIDWEDPIVMTLDELLRDIIQQRKGKERQDD